MPIEDLGAAGVDRIGAVDRTETIAAEYACVPTPDGRGLRLERVEVDPPRFFTWSKAGIAARIREWKPEIWQGGPMLGWSAGDRLDGFAIVGQRRADGTSELIALFVDAARRRQGLGRQLFAAAEARARDLGSSALDVASMRSAPTVDFYLEQGAELASLNDHRIVRGIGDIGPVKRLGEPSAD